MLLHWSEQVMKGSEKNAWFGETAPPVAKEQQYKQLPVVTTQLKSLHASSDPRPPPMTLTLKPKPNYSHDNAHKCILSLFAAFM